MSDTSTTESNWSKPYVRRRFLQAGLLALIAVATGFGLLTAAQADSLEEYLPTIVAGLGGIGAAGSALANIHRGSDSTATGDDVRRAEAGRVDPAAVAAEVRTVVDKRVSAAVNDLTARLRPSYGRHASPESADPAEVPGTYPGGES